LVPSYCHPFVAFSLGEYFSSGKSWQNVLIAYWSYPVG
jgi:hypothetical protein